MTTLEFLKDLKQNYAFEWKELDKAIAELEALQPMYKDIAEYEHLVGYKVNDSFKLGWNMGRAKLNEFDNWEAKQ